MPLGGEMKKAVCGIARTEAQATMIADRLKRSGFFANDSSLLLPDKSGTRDFGYEQNAKAPEGAVAGAGSGIVLGGALGWLVGIGALAIPGLGPFIAAGPIIGALAGAGAGGVVGGLVGALVGLGMPEYEAKRYEGQIRRGGILMSVHCDRPDWVKRAKNILEDTGAEDIASAEE